MIKDLVLFAWNEFKIHQYGSIFVWSENGVGYPLETIDDFVRLERAVITSGIRIGQNKFLSQVYTLMIDRKLLNEIHNYD